MPLPIVVILDHSGLYYANLQRRLKPEPFDIYMYYQNLKYLDEIAQLKPDLIVLGAQIGFPKNHHDVIPWLKTRPSLKHVPMILSLVYPLEEPDAERLGVHVFELEPTLEDFEPLVVAMHELVKPP